MWVSTLPTEQHPQTSEFPRLHVTCSTATHSGWLQFWTCFSLVPASLCLPQSEVMPSISSTPDWSVDDVVLPPLVRLIVWACKWLSLLSKCMGQQMKEGQPDAAPHCCCFKFKVGKLCCPQQRQHPTLSARMSRLFHQPLNDSEPLGITALFVSSLRITAT